MFELFFERSVDYYLPLQTHLTDTAIWLDDGSMFGMMKLSGFCWETALQSAVWHVKDRLNQTYLQIASDTIIVTIYECRGWADPAVYPRGNFRTEFARALDAKYKSQLFDRALYDNEIFVGIQIRPDQFVSDALSEYMPTMSSTHVAEVDHGRLQRLDNIFAVLQAEWHAYSPKRIGVRMEGRRAYSQIAETLLYAATGHRRKVPLTNGRLGEAMFTENIIFDGDTIRFLYPGHIWYGAMFGMKHFPKETWPGMLSGLLSAPYRCTTTHSLRFIQSATAQTLMSRKQYKMLIGSDPAVSQAAALSTAADNLQSTDFALGDYSFTHTAFTESASSLNDVANAAWSLLADSGMIVAREHLGLEAAFFSVFPGNARYRPRPGYISTKNFASLAPLHAFPTGTRKGYWGEPVAVFRNRAGIPFWFHFQVGDIGHTFACGRSGSGKSTWLGFVIAQSERLGATSVIWDKDRGLKILVRNLGGSYLELANPTGLAPLKALTNSDEDQAFLAELIRGLIVADGGRLTEEENRRLALALRIVMKMPQQARCLAAVRELMGSGAECAGARLDKYCAGREYGWIIDNDADVVSLDAPVIGFDQSYILDNAVARGPVMATLYHYVSKIIDGRRLLFVIDEFWKSLQDEAWRGVINDKLRTLRKFNSPMILASQSPHDALESPLRHVILDQCSQVFFANERADEKDYCHGGMGLTGAELDIVKSLGVGEFLIKQGNVSVAAQLMLQGFEKELAVISGRPSNVRVFNRVEAEMKTIMDKFHEERVREGTE